jgi:hypothetical protein
MSTTSTTDRLLVNKCNHKLQMVFLLFQEAANELNALIESINSRDETLPDLQKLMECGYQHELDQLQLVLPELHEQSNKTPTHQPIEQSTHQPIEQSTQSPMTQSPMIQSPIIQSSSGMYYEFEL